MTVEASFSSYIAIRPEQTVSNLHHFYSTLMLTGMLLRLRQSGRVGGLRSAGDVDKGTLLQVQTHVALE